MHRFMLAACAAFFCLAGPAMAQDFVSTAPVASPGDTMVDVNSWYALLQPYLTMLATTLITAAVGLITAKLNEWFGLKKEGELRDSLQAALTNAAGLLIQEIGAASATMKGLNVGNSTVAKALDYVQKAAPDAIKYFDLTPESLVKKIEAKLGLLTPMAGGAQPSIPISKPV